MSKRDWLLMAIGDYIEPIQLQKTLFKFAQEADAPPADRYQFIPYNWGPCSFEIYDDLAVLRGQGLVEFTNTARGWKAYRLTDLGQTQSAQTRACSDAKLVGVLDSIRAWVKSRPFKRLLTDVYTQYPAYAGRSFFEA